MALLEVHGPDRPLLRTEDPTPRQVTEAIDSLDGTCELYLAINEAVWLGIAAGPDRFFLAWTDDGESAIFQARTATGGDEGSFIVGGQTTTLAAEYLVAKEVAVTAAHHFLATGQRSLEVEWERM